MFRKVEQELGRKIPGALRKLSGGKWKWKPEWLDPLLFTYGKYSGVYWFKCSDLSERFKGWIFILTKGIEEAALHVPQESCIPLLHWENHLEKILEGMGYIVSIRRNLEPEFAKGRFCCEIEKGFDFPSYLECAETRQEAVQKAIIALAEGKEK